MAGSGVRSGITKSFRVLATDAPLIRREAWATLQEWAVCSSIFVVGRGVKAGLPGSMPRGTLNARSERVYNLRRSSGRRTAYICAASSAAALAVPQPQRCRLAQAIMEKTATAAQSRRRPRGVHALVSTCLMVAARVASLAATRTTSCRAVARCWSAAFVRGPLGPHFY